MKVKLAKLAMNIKPFEPVYDIRHPRSENINHHEFVYASKDTKKKLLLEMVKGHYNADQKFPFDHFFAPFDISLKKMLKGKKVLDLGCWCGGKSVSWAERWSVNAMYGIDINHYFIEAAIMFSSLRKNKKVMYNFSLGVAENLPYKKNFFDAIVSFDVFEHTQSLKDVIRECKRVLKPGGRLLAVFPPYKMPTESHLSFVTRTPCIHWIFDAQTLTKAYNEIIESRGESAYWYKSKNDGNSDWKKLSAGIGINGTSIFKYKSIIKKVGFSESRIFFPPLLSVGRTSIRNPRVKYVSNILKPLMKIEPVQDYLTHRIVSMLVK
jgi:ubiquinone/menaquinone biosynthesis C-methylase UbiE